MQDKVFIDSNIFIYAKIEDKEKDKHILARFFLNSLREKVEITTQVINEFYNVLDKYKIEDMIIQESIHAILTEVELKVITLETIKLSWKIKERYKYSYFDSLIIASTLESGCSTLYSEDMQHNQIIQEKLKIINPFEETSR